MDVIHLRHRRDHVRALRLTLRRHLVINSLGNSFHCVWINIEKRARPWTILKIAEEETPDLRRIVFVRVKPGAGAACCAGEATTTASIAERHPAAHVKFDPRLI